MSARASTPGARVRRTAPAVRDGHVRLAALLAGVVAALLVIGLVFSGSPGTLAPGTKVGGVDVGGMNPGIRPTKFEIAMKSDSVPMSGK